MSRRDPRPKIPAIACPHCGARSMVRTSEQVTPTYREMRLVCTDDECGHSFVASFSIIRTVRPSAKPNPAIHLPMSKGKPANDDVPEPANDTAPVDLGPTSMTGPG